MHPAQRRLPEDLSKAARHLAESEDHHAREHKAQGLLIASGPFDPRAGGGLLLRVPDDDVIGTLALQGVARELSVTISTGDKDMAQLVDGHITLVNTMTGSAMDVAGVKEKFGVAPEQIIDYLAFARTFDSSFPGFVVDVHGLQHEDEGNGRHYTVDCIKE